MIATGEVHRPGSLLPTGNEGGFLGESPQLLRCQRGAGSGLILLGVAFCLIPAAGRAQLHFEIKGRIETATYNPGDTSGAKKGSFSFVSIVGTNVWRIENDFAVGAEVKCYFDGTNVYDSMHPTSPPPDAVARRVAGLGFAIAPFAVAQSNLTITVATTPGGHPLGNVGVNLPWLAFCSGTYLKRSGRIVPLPVATLRHSPGAFGYSDLTETFQDGLGLPRKMKLLTSRALYHQSVEDFNREQFYDGPTADPPAVPDGLLKFHYEVAESTNVLGWNFPLRFEYRQYEIVGVGNPILRYAGEGTVTSIRSSAAPVGLFDPAMRQTVVDYRFRDTNRAVRSISYASTNASLLAAEDFGLQKKLASVAARSPLDRTQRIRAQLTCRALLCVVLISPLVIFAFRKMNNTKEK